MNSLITNKYFLIVTALFLAVSITIIWVFLPPQLRTFNDNQTAESQIGAKLAAAQADAADVSNLTANKTALADLYNQANVALPSSPAAELLLLQLDGLTKSLGINATITVPLSQGSLAGQVATPAASGDPSVVKAGSGSTGGSQPLVTNTGTTTNADWSISGTFDYQTALNLLTKLKAFARWNAVTSINIGGTTSTISGQVFWLPPSNLQFSGSAKDLLTQATNLFDQYQSYSTNPDPTTEGSFGKNDPFK